MPELSNRMPVVDRVVTPVVEQIQLGAVGFERPLFLLVPAVAAGVLAVAEVVHKRVPELDATQVKASQAYEQAVKDKEPSHFRRHTAIASLWGVAALAGVQAAGPYYESRESRSDASVMVILDTSTSMREAEDVSGHSRLDAALNALRKTDYNGKLGLVIAADGAIPAVALSDEITWRKNLDKKINGVSSNGGDIPAGIELASSLLPADTLTELVVITDGTTDTGSAMSATAEKLDKQGRQITVIMPGTTNGSYKLTANSSPVPVGVKPETYQGFNGVKPHIVDSTHDLEVAVNTALHDATSEKHKNNSNVPGYLAALFFGGALVRLTQKTVMKKQV